MSRLHFTFLILTAMLISQEGYASTECPWNKWSPRQLSKFEFDPQKTVSLTSREVQEDLSCLAAVIENHYSLRTEYPQAILPKIVKAIEVATPMTNKELLDIAFSFHDGFIDTHLSYETAGERRRFSTINPELVTMDVDLAREQVDVRPQFTYFKPAIKLYEDLSQPQTELIDHIKQHDRPLVIDLRGVRGGDNALAAALSKNLFTSDQYVPKSEILQIESGLKAIAFCNTLRMVYGNKHDQLCADVMTSVENFTFADLLKTTTSKEVDVTDYRGQRATRFRSAIYLIIDSSCASACETIVDKLKAHPNAKLVGAHTAGALYYSNALSLVLPHSGIKIAIPTRREIMEDIVPEGYGYTPDIPLKHIVLENILSL